MPHHGYHLLPLLLAMIISLTSMSASGEEDSQLDEQELLDEQFNPSEELGHRFLSPVASLILPGTGQMFNKEFGKGLLHMGIFAVISAQKNLYKPGDKFDNERSFFDTGDDNAIYINKDSLYHGLYGVAQLNTALYSAFDAYRVSTLSREDVPTGSIPVSRETFTDLALAPFTPKYLLDPYVAIPFAATFLYLVGSKSKISQSDSDRLFYQYSDDISKRELVATNLVKHEFVSVSEEAFFRGIINTEAIRYLGPATGIITSSLAFGVAHNGSGTSADAAVASFYGLYLGYIHYNHNGQLGYNIALHYWWNIMISLSIIDRSKEVSVPVFQIEF